MHKMPFAAAIVFALNLDVALFYPLDAISVWNMFSAVVCLLIMPIVSEMH